MALDALIEIAARAVVQFVGEVLLVGIFYWPGWLILRALTLGRYPPKRGVEHNVHFVAVVGLAAMIGVVTFYYSYAHA